MLGVSTAFHRPLAACERKLNMNWHDPELYLFLCDCRFRGGTGYC